jgi:hypothetical protein
MESTVALDGGAQSGSGCRARIFTTMGSCLVQKKFAEAPFASIRFPCSNLCEAVMNFTILAEGVRKGYVEIKGVMATVKMRKTVNNTLFVCWSGQLESRRESGRRARITSHDVASAFNAIIEGIFSGNVNVVAPREDEIPIPFQDSRLAVLREPPSTLTCELLKLSGESFSVAAQSSWTVEALKLRIEMETEIPVFEQELVFGSRKLCRVEIILDLLPTPETCTIAIRFCRLAIPECLKPEVVQKAWNAFLRYCENDSETVDVLYLGRIMELLDFVPTDEQLKLLHGEDAKFDFAGLIYMMAEFKEKFEFEWVPPPNDIIQAFLAVDPQCTGFVRPRSYTAIISGLFSMPEEICAFSTEILKTEEHPIEQHAAGYEESLVNWPQGLFDMFEIDIKGMLPM